MNRSRLPRPHAAHLLLGLLVPALFALPALAPAPADAQRFPGQSAGPYWPRADVRVWVDGERDLLRRGDRVPIRFSTTEDAHVAVVHIDTDGNLEFLFPRSPWDDDFVRGGRVHALPASARTGWAVRGRPGIGYLYVIASPYPLDFRYFRGSLRGSAWDWSYGGHVVRGDPFWALHQISRLLVPSWGYTPVAVDYFSYHLDGRHTFPAYACSPFASGAAGWGWGSAFHSCDRMSLFLRDHPYYFDARRYRGDRRQVWRGYEPFDPRHGFKAAPDRPSGRGVLPAPSRAVEPRQAPAPAQGRGGTAVPARRPQPEPAARGGGEPAPQRPSAEPARRPAAQPAPRSADPAPAAEPARRPTLERRDPPSEPRAEPAPAPRPSGDGDAPRRARPRDGG